MSGVDRRLWSIQLKAHLGKIGGHCPSDGGGKVFCISRDHMINESRGSVGEILSP